MIIFLWIVAVIGILIFWQFVLKPYIADKITFWYIGKSLRKMAKGKNPEDAKAIIEAADLCDQIRKETRL